MFNSSLCHLNYNLLVIKISIMYVTLYIHMRESDLVDLTASPLSLPIYMYNDVFCHTIPHVRYGLVVTLRVGDRGVHFY